jgi:hypothetical protein
MNIHYGYGPLWDLLEKLEQANPSYGSRVGEGNDYVIPRIATGTGNFRGRWS